jgi:hypothetical protein
MLKKKKFTISTDSRPFQNEELSGISLLQKMPTNTVISFPASTSSIRNYDFSNHFGHGYDEILLMCFHVITKILADSISSKGKTLSIVSIITYCRDGVDELGKYCRLRRSTVNHDLTISDVNLEFVTGYIVFLTGLNIGYTTQRNRYTSTKSVLSAAIKQGYLSHAERNNLFPKNPYPKSNQRQKGEQPLTQLEKQCLTKALSIEMRRISKETGPLSGHDLVVCCLAIGLSCGMNLTPILELPVDCVQPHPLKTNQRLLVAYKRRGNSTQIFSLRKSRDLAIIKSVKVNVADAIDIIISRNQCFRTQYKDPNRLFVYRTNRKFAGRIVHLTSLNLCRGISAFVEKNQLKNDDGNAMRLNISRLRKTFINRIWELSNQDPLTAAKLGKHTLRVANQHYWVAPPEAEKGMNFLGEARITDLLKKEETTTPIAACKDNKNGHFAPKNGRHCTEIISCFKCKSFVITKDDLYRLFSFYFAILNGRKDFGAKRWKKVLRHILRVIDDDITPKFSTTDIKKAQDKAKAMPHPFWRNLDMLGFSK